MVDQHDTQAAPAHGNASHGPGGDDFAHTTPMFLLIGVFAALTVLTILTVSVTSIDLGAYGNFVVAMIIATIKAGLVMAYFMHMAWDKKFNVVVFLTSFLFVILFLTMSLTDRREYQDNITTFHANQAAAEAANQ